MVAVLILDLLVSCSLLDEFIALVFSEELEHNLFSLISLY